jgi:signal transduction histidine kinase
MRFTAQQLDGVEIESQINDGDRVIGSRTHITQVLVNLITNAAYAVESVRSERTPRIKIVTQPNGQRLYVRVQDNGVGMNPDVASRIFDPFFTTREVGQGTGLGLSICHTIVKNHGGRIQVKSEKGHGTEMSFDLPLLAKVESQA